MHIYTYVFQSRCKTEHFVQNVIGIWMRHEVLQLYTISSWTLWEHHHIWTYCLAFGTHTYISWKYPAFVSLWISWKSQVSMLLHVKLVIELYMVRVAQEYQRKLFGRVWYWWNILQCYGVCSCISWLCIAHLYANTLYWMAPGSRPVSRTGDTTFVYISGLMLMIVYSA